MSQQALYKLPVFPEVLFSCDEANNTAWLYVGPTTTNNGWCLELSRVKHVTFNEDRDCTILQGKGSTWEIPGGNYMPMLMGYLCPAAEKLMRVHYPDAAS